MAFIKKKKTIPKLLPVLSTVKYVDNVFLSLIKMIINCLSDVEKRYTNNTVQKYSEIRCFFKFVHF